jgi:Ca2+/Na+ antiporter
MSASASTSGFDYKSSRPMVTAWGLAGAAGAISWPIGWFVSSWRGGRIVGLVLVGLGAAGPILAMAAVAAVQPAPILQCPTLGAVNPAESRH